MAGGMEIAADAMRPETIVKNTFPVASHVRRLHEGWRRSPAKDAQIAALGKDIPEVKRWSMTRRAPASPYVDDTSAWTARSPVERHQDASPVSRAYPSNRTFRRASSSSPSHFPAPNATSATLSNSRWAARRSVGM